MKENIYNFKWFRVFIVYTLLYWVISWQTNSTIHRNTFYQSSLDRQLEPERIADFIQIMRKYQVWGYAVLPFVLLIKWSLISGIIYAGVIVFNQKVSFAQCFRITMIAELANVTAGCSTLACFLICKSESPQDIQFFYPLSAAALVNRSGLPSYLIYPLQQLNLFEIFYWVLLALGVAYFTQISFKKSFAIVSSSYGVALCIWILFVIFLQL